MKQLKATGGTCAKRHRMICLDCQKRYKRALRDGKKGTELPIRGRYTIRRPPPWIPSVSRYKTMRMVKCPHCGSENVRSDEANRQAEQRRQDTCFCAPVPFPHQKGTVLGCIHHPKEEWDEGDHEQFQVMLATPRSG